MGYLVMSRECGADRLPATPPVETLEGVDLGEVLIEAPGRCPVCSEPVLDRALVCPGCHTGHHAECVRFNGACGVFGCGCGAPSEVAPAASSLEPVLTRALLHSMPARFLQNNRLTYVWLTWGAVLAMMVASNAILNLSSAIFALGGTSIACLCQAFFDAIERRC